MAGRAYLLFPGIPSQLLVVLHWVLAISAWLKVGISESLPGQASVASSSGFTRFGLVLAWVFFVQVALFLALSLLFWLFSLVVGSVQVCLAYLVGVSISSLSTF